MAFHSDALSRSRRLDWSCTHPVGFYQFLMWLEKQGETGAARFALACTRYKDIPIDSERQQRGLAVRPQSESRRESGEGGRAGVFGAARVSFLNLPVADL